MSIQIRLIISILVILPMLSFLIIKVRQANVLHVYIVFYAFSLMLVTALLTIYCAYLSGFIDGEGMPHGPIGNWIVAGVDFLSDPLADVKIAGVILAIIILPQVLAYALSGVFGAALTIRLFPAIWKAMVWFIVKGFASVSGLFLALNLSGLFIRVNSGGFNLILQILLLAFLLLTLSFALIWITFDFEQTLHSSSNAKRRADLPRRNLLNRLHSWATRHVA